MSEPMAIVELTDEICLLNDLFHDDWPERLELDDPVRQRLVLNALSHPSVLDLLHLLDWQQPGDNMVQLHAHLCALEALGYI